MHRPPSATSISFRLFLILWLSLTAMAMAATWNWMTETRYWTFLEVTAIAALVTAMLHVVLWLSFRPTR